MIARLEQVQRNVEAGATNAALRELMEMLGRADLKPWRAPVLQRTLQLLLAAHRLEEAQSLFLKHADDGEDVLEPSFGLISQYLQDRNDLQELARWHERLAARPWSPPRAAAVWLWHLDSQRCLGRGEQVLALLPEALRRLPVSESKRMLETLLTRCLDQGNSDLAGRIVETLESQSELGPEAPKWASIWRLQIVLAQKQWPEADRLFREQVLHLDDATVAELLRRIGRAASAHAAWEAFDDLFRYAALETRRGEASAEWAARYWVWSAEKRRDAVATVDRLGQLLESGLPAPALARLCTQVFYPTIKMADAENQKRLVQLVRQIRDALAAQGHQAQVQDMDGLLLDGAVLQHDYAGALSLLDKGVGPSDPSWRRMAETKLRAHLALENGNVEEAIRLFRAFMESVREQPQGTVDPVTGLRHTPDMTLGLNAKRIGDLYDSIGRREDARQAYHEAVAHYRAALSAVGEESDEGRWIRERLSEIEKLETPPED